MCTVFLCRGIVVYSCKVPSLAGRSFGDVTAVSSSPPRLEKNVPWPVSATAAVSLIDSMLRIFHLFPHPVCLCLLSVCLSVCLSVYFDICVRCFLWLQVKTLYTSFGLSGAGAENARAGRRVRLDDSLRKVIG